MTLAVNIVIGNICLLIICIFNGEAQKALDQISASHWRFCRVRAHQFSAHAQERLFLSVANDKCISNLHSGWIHFDV